MNDLMMVMYGSRRPSPKWTKAWSSWCFDQARVLSYLLAKRLIPRWSRQSQLEFTLDLVKSLCFLAPDPLQEAPKKPETPKRRSGTMSFTPTPVIKRLKTDSSPTKRLHQPQMMYLSSLPPDHPAYDALNAAKATPRKCVLCRIRFRDDQKKARHRILTFCAQPSCMKFLCMDRNCHSLYHEEAHLRGLVLDHE